MEARWPKHNAVQMMRWMRRFGELLGSSRSVSGTYVHSLLPVLAQFGLDADALLAEVGVDGERLRQPDYRLPLFDAFRLAELAAQRSGDPCFGLRAGQHVRARSFQVLGYAAMTSANLQGAIECLLRFEKLTWDIGVSELAADENPARLRLIPQGLSLVPDQVIELAISGWLRFGRWILGGELPVEEVRFRHRPVAPLERYEELLGCPVRFGQPFNEVLCPPSLLARPLIDADPELLASMDRRGAQMLAQYRHGLNVVNEVRSQIFAMLSSGEPQLDAIAERLDLSPRQLRQRLRQAGTSFQAQLDDVRKSLALLHLSDPTLELIDIAFLLGFSEQSAFHRAFKRWQGETPGSYRLRLPPA